MSNLEEEIMIPPDSKRLRHDDGENENENEDLLSNLHDCVLLHILSFLNAKHAVRTCILSTRWKYLWKRLPTLILNCRDFRTRKIFMKFVSRVLSLRDDSASLHALDFYRNGSMDLHLLKRIVNYAISHNVNRLQLSVSCEIEQIPSTIFSCHTLTHLKLSIYGRGSEGTLFPKSLNLPALTSLSLQNFAFCTDNGVADPFLTFNKLNSLVLCSYKVRDALTLRISSSTLVHLSMYSRHSKFLKIELCTPSLFRFVFSGVPNMRFYGSDLSSVKQVDIDAELDSNCVHSPFILIYWLLDFVSIKSLVLTASTLQVLSFIPPDLLKARLPFLENLKSLKVKNEELSYGLCMQLRDAKLQKAKSRKEAAKLKKELKANFTLSPPLPDGIVDFLLQNSPSTKADIGPSSYTCSWESADIIRDY